MRPYRSSVCPDSRETFTVHQLVADHHLIDGPTCLFQRFERAILEKVDNEAWEAGALPLRPVASALMRRCGEDGQRQEEPWSHGAVQQSGRERIGSADARAVCGLASKSLNEKRV